MASAKNDELLERTVEGSINFYDNQKCQGTATNKGLAARLGGHSYNILSNQGRDEIYFQEMRHGDHFVDQKNRHTAHMFGDRRRKVTGTRDSSLIASCLVAPSSHPREDMLEERRRETQLAQMENPASWKDFQSRAAMLFPRSHAKQYSIHNRKYANEVECLTSRISSRTPWLQRRGEPLVQSISCPSLLVHDPVASLKRAERFDARKGASQHQTESAHAAPWSTANSYSMSMDSTSHAAGIGSEVRPPAGERHCSVNRIENGDFAVARKNNHFSSQDKLTRSDAYFMRPRASITNNSVKYDILSNERRWFRY